jgi:hypothetical protein
MYGYFPFSSSTLAALLTIFRKCMLGTLVLSAQSYIGRRQLGYTQMKVHEAASLRCIHRLLAPAVGGGPGRQQPLRIPHGRITNDRPRSADHLMALLPAAPLC